VITFDIYVVAGAFIMEENHAITTDPIEYIHTQADGTELNAKK
jgi:hypothetical protein